MPGWEMGTVTWQRREGPPLGASWTDDDYDELATYFDWEFRAAYNVVNGSGPKSTGEVHFEWDRGIGDWTDFASDKFYEPAHPPFAPNFVEATLSLQTSLDVARTLRTRLRVVSEYGTPTTDEIVLTTAPPGPPHPMLGTRGHAHVVKLLSPVRTITGIFDNPYAEFSKIAGTRPKLVVATDHAGSDCGVGAELEVVGEGTFKVRRAHADGMPAMGDGGLTTLLLEKADA